MKMTCQHVKTDGEKCKHSVAVGQSLCWQHAKGWSKKWRSLTLSHKLTILSITVALFFGVQRMLSSSPSRISVTSSGDNSPNVVDNSGKVDVQIDSSKKAKQK
jgi:hypothetical protein